MGITQKRNPMSTKISLTRFRRKTSSAGDSISGKEFKKGGITMIDSRKRKRKNKDESADGPINTTHIQGELKKTENRAP